MSKHDRTTRIQIYLNDQHKSGVAVDGRYGLETIGALEKALNIEEWSKKQGGINTLKNKFDSRTEKNLASLDPKAARIMRKLVTEAMKIADENNVIVKVISGHRTWAEQDALYAKGRTKPGSRVTNARGGYSNHNFGTAIDFAVFQGPVYLDGGNKTQRNLASKVHKAIADKGAAKGIATEWGGNWKSLKDYPHHEVAVNLSMKEKRKKYLSTGSVMA